MTPTLEIAHLSISFDQYDHGLQRRTVTPVTDMSVTAYDGEVVSIVGASGAGKSLVGLATMGLLPPNARETGTVAFHGEEIGVKRRRELAGTALCMLPQSDSYLDPTAKISNQLRRAATLAGLDDPGTAARAAFERRELPTEAWNQYPHELSGGMARRVLFAIATLPSPDVIFADEPTPGLHPQSAIEVMNDIRAIAERGTAVILVSHDVDLAATISDRIIVCDMGRTIEELHPDQLVGDGHDLRETYTRQLIHALPTHGFRAPAEDGVDAASELAAS